MTRLTDEELRMLQRDVRSDPEVKTPALIVGAIDELLALRAERDMLAAALRKQDAEVAQLRGADERAALAVVRELREQMGRVPLGPLKILVARPQFQVIADWIAQHWREWVARENGETK